MMISAVVQAFHHILTTTNNITTAKKVFLQFSERIVSIGAVTGENSSHVPIVCTPKKMHQSLLHLLFAMMGEVHMHLSACERQLQEPKLIHMPLLGLPKMVMAVQLQGSWNQGWG